MKDVLIALGILSIILVFCLVSNSVLSRHADKTVSHLEQAFDCAQDGNFEAATDAVRRAETHWKEQDGWFGVVLRHDETDRIIGTLAKLEVYGEKEIPEEFCAQCRELIQQIEHIANMQKPKINNILSHGAVGIGKESRFIIRDSFHAFSDVFTFRRGAY